MALTVGENKAQKDTPVRDIGYRKYRILFLWPNRL